MAEIEFIHVSKSYGDTPAVRDLNLQVAEGEFVVLVGPSGCGKTTALRMVAGLEEITSGEIRIGDRIVNELAPRDRDIAMVFQNYALYPHKIRLREPRVRVAHAQGAQGRSSAGASRRSRRSSAWPTCSTAGRRSSPAARGSVLRWAARSSASRRRS